MGSMCGHATAFASKSVTCLSVRTLAAALGLYAFLGLFMDGPASVATGLIGLKIAPHFDAPYLSSSLTDFWSRRWNLTASNALRFLVRRRAYTGSTFFGSNISWCTSLLTSDVFSAST